MNSSYDFVVVGAGVAGLRAAIELASHGEVLCLAKREVTESNTQYAQGGIAVALSDEDEIGIHLQDTIAAGAGLVDEAAARVLVEEGPQCIEELLHWGTEFDRQGTKLAFTREAAHSRNRILHAHGDSTGREIGRALYARASKLPNIEFAEFAFTTDLWVQDGAVIGIHVLEDNGVVRSIRSRAVLLATGGLGQVYANTTNPSVATGDGPAIAHRAGAELSDMEFVQFHPTALYVKGAPRFLLSEALRGEGAYLRNAQLHRFMPRYSEMGELAPRDVVARAIHHELVTSGVPDPVVYLDLTHLSGDRMKKRFPRIYSTCMQYNIDFTIDLVPIRPAAHYAMGGVRTDLDGHSSLPGLYAAGEAACTGVHGANRLASNSLLEGLVFGARAARTMAEEPELEGGISSGAEKSLGKVHDGPVESLIEELQQVMWRHVSIVRDAKGLREAIARLDEISAKLPEPKTRREWEARNIAQCGRAITCSALARLESRGGHYRIDYPETDDARFRKHSVYEGGKVRFE